MTANALARDVTPAEMATKDAWVQAALWGSTSPFSFVYAGRPGAACLADWPGQVESQPLDAARTQHTLTWTDPATGLEVRCVAVDYADFPAVEWTVYFTNHGAQDTPILEQAQGLDTQFESASGLPADGPAGGEFRLHYLRGDHCAADGYQPFDQPLWCNLSLTMAPLGGRGSNSAFPYFNLQMPGGGLFLAVGWPGQWATAFRRDAERGLQVTAGQELTHLSLRPGEQIRTPLIALLFWGPSANPAQGSDLERAQNLWRRWMWAHNVPRTAGDRLPPPILHGNTSVEFDEMCNANEENQRYFIGRYAQEGVRLDYWWMDAGWYPCGGRWPQTGTWEPDRTRFPNGLRAISDHARSGGVKTLVWFEPERVAPGTWLYENHPEWLLTRPGGPHLSVWSRTFRLLNLGDRVAWSWLVDHVDALLQDESIDLYRQDFNIDPLEFWRSTDARLSPTEHDRQGVTENLYLQGYLAYWDELRHRHPDLIIDSCASGGRRNDLETMRRAVPLHPTDYNYGHLAVKQAFHRALIQWIPYFGSNVVPADTVQSYAFRSGHGTSLVIGFDLRRADLDYALLRRLVDEWRSVIPYYYGDFYPLTPYTVSEEDWLAWQFHRPETGDGLVQAYRRAGSGTETQVWSLRGLEPEAEYVVETVGAAPGAAVVERMTGRWLGEQGLAVTCAERPGAVIVRYHKVD
jgi:alpha-galactosidase